MSKDIVIVVPIYKVAINKDEEKSIRQLFSVLGKHTIAFIFPEGLDLSFYKYISETHNLANCSFNKFPSYFFESIYGYNQLLTSVEFHSRF